MLESVDCVELKSSFRDIKVNLILRITLRVSLDLWILYDQLSFKMNKDKIKSFQSKRKASLASDYSNSDEGCRREKNVASTAVTSASTTAVVNTNIQP